STTSGLRSANAWPGHGHMPAYTSFSTPSPHRLRAVVKTRGLALHDARQERISALFPEPPKLSRFFEPAVSRRRKRAFLPTVEVNSKTCRPLCIGITARPLR